MKRPRTPEELSKLPKRKGFHLYLNIDSMSYLQERANKAGVSISQVIDEAIRLYIKKIQK